MQTTEGAAARTETIDKINQHYDEAVESIMDPYKEEREHRAVMANPVLSAGVRGLERLKWDLIGERANEQAQALRNQGL